MASDTTSQRRDGQELAADVDALANQAVLADVEQEAKSRSGKDAADRRLPLIARVYGVLVLLQGVITLPVIVLMAGYSVHEILDGRVTVDVLNLTFILTCAQTVVSSANAACLTVLGVLLIRNRRRYSAWWSYIVMMVTFAEGLLSLALDGLGANLLVPSIQMTILVALAITLDPTLLEERRLQRALRRMDERDEYEAALAKGMVGRDMSGKGYISLDFFNLFWIFVIGCMIGLVVETIYHWYYYGEYQDRAGMLWGPFSPIYGFGAGFMTILLNRLWRSNWVLIFFSSALIGGVFEYCSSWFMEVAFGIKAWDYTGEWLSIGGRTSGKYMVFWGIMGLAWIKFVLPYLLKFINLIPWKVRYSLTAVVFVLLFIDGMMTLMAFDCLVRAHGGACAGFADHAVLRRPFRQRFHGEPVPDHVHRPVQGRAHVGRGPCAGGVQDRPKSYTGAPEAPGEGAGRVAMSSKLVFLDIDGTLADERHEVPISAQEACKAARSRGHKLFICTGRSMPKIERGILDLGFDGVISVAGAQADVNGRVLFRHDIAPEAIDAATAYFERHGIENYQWQGADGMYISCGYARHLESKGSAVWKNGQFARYWHLIDDIAVPDGSTLGHVIHASKGSYFSGADPDVSFDDVSRDLGEWFTLVHGSYDDISPNNGELLINGVDKGTALCDVAKDLGYSIADTIAIGDSDNDTAMLKAAGTSVAMGNATHGIECFCDMTTTDIHDDGIANAFVTLGLI